MAAKPPQVSVSPLTRRPKDGARLAALRSPFGNLRPITLATMRQPTLAGRGGSVSRRDHNQAYRRRATFQAEPTEKKCRNPNASRSSGKRGLGGEALLSEKRPLPPESLTHLCLLGNSTINAVTRTMRGAATTSITPGTREAVERAGRRAVFAIMSSCTGFSPERYVQRVRMNSCASVMTYT